MLEESHYISPDMSRYNGSLKSLEEVFFKIEYCTMIIVSDE